MEMSQIRYVLAAAKHLNFTKAATECNVTQPALTKGVKALEAELGTDLFSRENRRVLLTDFGASMLPHLQQIADQAEATREMANDYRLLKTAPIRLGVVSTLGHVRFAQFLAEFHRSAPTVELTLGEAKQDQLIKELDDGEIDAAVMTKTDAVAADFNCIPLYAERYVVAFPPGHKLARQNAVPLQELSGENYVDRLSCEMREIVNGLLQERKIELYARFRSEREDWVQAMVHAGIGFAFMPEYSVTLPGLIQRPLIDPYVAREVSLVTARGRRYSPAVESMVRKIRAFPWPA